MAKYYLKAEIQDDNGKTTTVHVSVDVKSITEAKEKLKGIVEEL